jgi:homospermidine synthase
MAKKLVLPVFLALAGLTFPSLAPSGFTLLVVDEQTGVGIPSLRVTDENGMVRRTGSHGELIIWHRTPATSNGSRFEIQDDQSLFENVNATLKVIPAGRATLKIQRRT